MRSLSGDFRWRIFIYMAAAIIFLALAVDLAIYEIHRQQLLRQINENGRLLASLLAGSARVGVLSENIEYLRPPVEMTLKQSYVEAVVVYNREGRVLYSATRTSGEQPLPPMPAIRADGSVDSPVETSGSYVFREPVWAALAYSSPDPIYFEPGTAAKPVVIGCVCVEISKDILTGVYWGLVREALLIFGLFLTIALPLTYKISKEATAPLKKLLTEIATKMDKGDTQSELRLLSDTYSSLVAELEQSFATINELREGLEERVQERTLELTRSNQALHKALEELKMTQAQLLHSEKLAGLGVVAGGVAHEINNANNFINGSLACFERALQLQQKQKETGSSGQKPGELFSHLPLPPERLIHNMRVGISRITRIVRDLISFARPEIADVAPVDLNYQLDLAVQFASSSCHERINFIRNYQELPPVICHAGHMGQVFINVLSNAVQAIAQQGEIMVETKLRKEQVVITISDTGSGIAAMHSQKVFDPFFTTKEVGQGMGLGLGVVYGIVTKHGGQVTIDSVEGQGTTVTIILPLQPPAGIVSPPQRGLPQSGS